MSVVYVMRIRPTTEFGQVSWSLYLSLFDGGSQPIAHGADVESLLSFQITLTKELLHDAVVPLSVERQRLGWVAQVGAVNQALQHLHHSHARTTTPLITTVDSNYKVITEIATTQRIIATSCNDLHCVSKNVLPVGHLFYF